MKNIKNLKPLLVFRTSLVAFLLVALMGFVAVLPAKEAIAATSSTINFQARLMTGSGAIVADGDYNVEFKLFNALTSSGSSQGSCSGDAACLWTETRVSANKVHVANGYLTVDLGSVTAFGGSINWDQNLYLTMNIGGTASPAWDGEMTPRLKLTAVPYAFRAGMLATMNGANVGTLGFVQPTATRTMLLPDESGTVCLQSSAACGFATGTTGSYIQNQNASQQATSNFWISGTGRADTALQAPLLDTASAGTLSLGTTNATAINLNQNTTIAATKALTVAGGTTTLTSAASGVALTVNGVAASGAIAQIQDNSNNVLTIAYGGAITHRTVTNNFAGLAIQDSAGAGIVRVDTTSRKVAIGAHPTATSDNISGQLQVTPINDARSGIQVKAFGAGYTANYFEAVTSSAVDVFQVQSTGAVRNTNGVFGSFLQTAASTASTGATFGSGAVSGATSNSGTVTIASGASSTSGNTGAITVGSGNATSGNSGNITIDSGTASGTTGSISIGTSNTSSVTIGRSASVFVLQGTSASTIKGTSGSFTTTLGFTTPTGNRTIDLPNESGTLCIQSSSACGFAAGTAASYIQNSTTLQTVANFAIQTGAVGDTTAVIRALTSQTADLMQFQALGGGPIAGVRPSGTIYSAPISNPVTDVPNARLYIQPLSNGSVAAIFRTASGGTSGDILQLQNSGGSATYLSVGGAGATTLTNNSASGFQVNQAGGPQVFVVDTANQRVAVGSSAPTLKFEVQGGDAAVYNSGNNARLVIGDSSTSGQYGWLQWDSANDYFRIETLGSNGLKINNNFVTIGNIYPSEPLTVALGTTLLFQVSGTGTIFAQNSTNSNTGFDFKNAGNTSIFTINTNTSSTIINGALNVAGIQPASVAGNGTNGTLSNITGAKGGNTSGTTGQSAGNGSSVYVVAGAGGNAPSGSANGWGGAVFIDGGAPGAGAGGGGLRGNVILQSAGGVVGIGTSSPNFIYSLDSAGSINIGSGMSYYINGVAICSSTGCTASSASAIRNQTSAQNANFNIVSAAIGSIAAVIQGASGQTADLLNINDGAGVAQIKVNAAGSLSLLTKPTSAAATGAIEIGSIASQSGNDVNGVIGFPGYGVGHAQIAYAVGDGFYLCNATSSPSGDYGQCAGRVNLYAQNAHFNGTFIQSGSGTFATGTGAVSLNGSTTVDATKTLTVTSGLTSLTGNTTGDALNVSNSSSTGNIALFKDNATTVASIADGGAVFFQNAADSAAAFRVQAASSGPVLFNIDSTSRIINVGISGSVASTSTVNIANTSGNATQAVNIGSNGNTSNTIDIDGGTGATGIEIGNTATAHGIQIGTGAAIQTLSIGSTNSSSATSINAGSGNMLLNATSGTVTIQTTTSGAINLKPGGTSNVTIGTSDTASTLFVLDADTDNVIIGTGNGLGAGTEPTPVNGAMYYNTTSQRFRCAQDSVWRNCVGFDADGNRTNPSFSVDFVTGDANSALQYYPWQSVATNSATRVSSGFSVADHPGVLRITGAAVANTGGSVLTDISSVAEASTLILEGQETLEFIFKMTTTANTVLRGGFHNSPFGTADATDGAYFEILGTTLRGRIANTSTRTASTTSFTVVAGTWYRARVVVDNGLAGADFTLYNMSGTEVWSEAMTTALNATNNTGSGVTVYNTAGTTGVLLDLDYMAMWWPKALTR